MNARRPYFTEHLVEGLVDKVRRTSSPDVLHIFSSVDFIPRVNAGKEWVSRGLSNEFYETHLYDVHTVLSSTHHPVFAPAVYADIMKWCYKVGVEQRYLQVMGDMISEYVISPLDIGLTREIRRELITYAHRKSSSSATNPFVRLSAQKRNLLEFSLYLHLTNEKDIVIPTAATGIKEVIKHVSTSMQQDPNRAQEFSFDLSNYEKKESRNYRKKLSSLRLL